MTEHGNAGDRPPDAGGIVLAVGEVLFDVFPSGRRIGGAPFNFACQLHSLGFPVCFVSSVGNDGREILDFMSGKGMRTDGIQHDPMLLTGRVDVTVDAQGIPTYDILEDRAWDRIGFSHSLTKILEENIAIVCFGSLAQRSPRSRDTIGRILDKLGPQTVRVCDLNLRQNFHSVGLIEECLQRADIVKLSEDELETVAGLFGKGGSGGGEDFPAQLVEEFALRCLCVTRGSDGSELHLPGRDAIRRSAVTDRLAGGHLKDTVGAGDAYTAMLCAGFLMSLPWERVIEMASRFAAALCTVRGALPESDDFYAPFMEELERERNG